MNYLSFLFNRTVWKQLPIRTTARSNKKIKSRKAYILLLILLLIASLAPSLYGQVNQGELSIAGSIADGEWAIYDTDNSSLPGNYVTSLAIGDGGVIWIGTDTGIASLDGQRWNLFPLIGLQGSHILSVATESQSTESRTRTVPSVWVAVGDTLDGNMVGLGLARYDRRVWDQVDSTNSGLHSNDIKKIGFGSNNTGWAIPLQGFTLSHYDGNDWSAHSPSESAQREYERAGLTAYSAGFVDDGGLIWLAVGGSLVCYDGESWTQVFGTIGRRGIQEFSSIAVAPSGDVWVGSYSGEVQHFVGETVTSHDPGIDGAITSIALDLNENPWVGAHGTLAYFNGEVWTLYNSENTDLTRLNVNAIAIDQEGNKWIGTDEGLGVFKLTDIGTSAEPGTANSGIPERAVLHGNYPNPFNPSTTFVFDLPEAAMVRLVVYDALGRKVATVISERLPAGRYEYAWNARHLPSGMYLNRLEAGEYRQIRRMVLVK